MHLLYLDDAGSAGNSDERYFVLAGICLFERQVHWLCEAMDSVERRFGTPESVRGPVGEPPITRWQYPRFEVVFEDDRVIHTVIPPDTDG